MRFILLLSGLSFAYATRILGACKDTYGCHNCAGYTWCNVTETCIRFWETNCGISPPIH